MLKKQELTKEQKQAVTKLEGTLNTLSEEELDQLCGGVVTDDIKNFFKSEKGKKVMGYTAAILGTAAITIPTTILVTRVVIKRSQKKNKVSSTDVFLPSHLHYQSVSTDVLGGKSALEVLLPLLQINATLNPQSSTPPSIEP